MMEYITNMYRRIRLNSFFIVKDILSSCLALVTSSSSSRPPNEDIQVSMCSAIKQLILASHDGQGGGVISDIMSQSNNMKLPLSHLIFTCLTWAEDNKTPTNVKLSSLDLLTSLCKDDEGSLHHELGLMSCSMLPGVTSKLAKLSQEQTVSHSPVLIC